MYFACYINVGVCDVLLYVTNWVSYYDMQNCCLLYLFLYLCLSLERCVRLLIAELISSQLFLFVNSILMFRTSVFGLYLVHPLVFLVRSSAKGSPLSNQSVHPSVSFPEIPVDLRETYTRNVSKRVVIVRPPCLVA
jgi:hypothetical protein